HITPHSPYTTLFRSFFQIPERAVRKDIRFVNGVLELPFKMPETRKMEDFVRTIESYWKFSGIEVQLDFQSVQDIPNLSLKENSIDRKSTRLNSSHVK